MSTPTKPVRSVAFLEGLRELGSEFRAMRAANPRPEHAFEIPEPLPPPTPAPTMHFVTKEPKA